MTSRRRIDVWHAMSELFLDTEVRPAIPHIALTCVRSGYNDAMLEHVFQHEVSPILWWNMLAVTGEWAFFSEEWLLTRLREKPFPASRWQRFRGHLRFLPRDDWWLTGELVRYLRGLADHERDQRCATLKFLIDAYFEPGPFLRPGAPVGDDAPTQQRIFDDVLRDKLPRLIVKGVERWTPDDGARRVAAAIALR